MTCKTKQQIQDDKAKILDKKALSKLNTHLDEFPGLSDEEMAKVNYFIELMVYK